MNGLIGIGTRLVGGGILSSLTPILIAGAIGAAAVLGMSILGDVRDAATLKVRAQQFAKIAESNAEAVKLKGADLENERALNSQLQAASDQRQKQTQARLRAIEKAHAKAVRDRQQAIDALAAQPECPKPEGPPQCSLDSISPPLP